MIIQRFALLVENSVAVFRNISEYYITQHDLSVFLPVNMREYCALISAQTFVTACSCCLSIAIYKIHQNKKKT